MANKSVAEDEDDDLPLFALPLPPASRERTRRLLNIAENQQSDDSSDNEIRSLAKLKLSSKKPPQKCNTPSKGGRQPSLTDGPPSTRTRFEPFDLKKREMSEEGVVFCPFKLVSQYPWRFVSKAREDEVATFFRVEKFNDRSWDLFYLHDPRDRKNPIIFVPTVQFDDFLEFANTRLEAKLKIPQGDATEFFHITFGDFGNPRPRFLGRVTSEAEYKGLCDTLGGGDDDFSGLERQSLFVLQEKWDEIYEFLKAKEFFKGADSKKNPEAQRLKKTRRQKDWGRTTKRVQRYLGLRFQTAYAHLLAAPQTPWTVETPAPFKMESGVKFVCVDVEAYEKNHDIVTEIGLAVLDTDDLIGVPPKQKGENWFKLIKAYHLRIAENSWAVNEQYVKGCPDSFNFGKSEDIAEKLVADKVAAIIGDMTVDNEDPVVLVGHDIMMDLKYLRKIGYNIWQMPHATRFVDEIDTSLMFQHVQMSSQARSLGAVCSELGIWGHNFHNGGNDAVYTLQAMLAMAVGKKAGGLPDYSFAWGPRNGTRFTDWSDGEADDGGWAARSQEPKEAPPRPPPAPPRSVHETTRW